MEADFFFAMRGIILNNGDLLSSSRNVAKKSVGFGTGEEFHLKFH